MNIDPILNNKPINYRPISFSETHLDDLKKLPLLKNYSTDELMNNKIFNEIGIQTEAQTEAQTKADLYEITINKLILFFIHLFLIAMFELIFFFNFVTKYEDRALVDVFNQMTNQATSFCSSLNQYDKTLIDDFLSMFLNTTKINQDANNSYNIRSIYNNTLLLKAIYYFLFVSVINMVLILLNCVWFRRKINYKTIIIDNFVMITFLGLFEYLFFSTIVFNYQTISPNELNRQISNTIINNC